MALPRICSILNCGKPSSARGYCRAHYTRYWRHGSPTAGRIATYICSVPGCGRKHHAHGLCSAHDFRNIRYGNPNDGGFLRDDLPKFCRVEPCGKKSSALGYCSKHYDNLKRRGDPLVSGTKAANGARLRWIIEHVGYEGQGCLSWPFGALRGHPAVTANGKQIKAHRLMCILVHNDPPTSKHHAAHNCGNGHHGCLNPNHLRWATRKENMDDKVEHGTAQRGQKHWRSKLSDKDVLQIRSLKGLMSLKKIASKFGISSPSICNIYSGKTWAWLKDAVAPGHRKTGTLTAYSWRKTVFKRDGFACRRCGDNCRTLSAHHINSYLSNPECRLTLENGITLCITCHRGFHGKYGNRGFGRAQMDEYLGGFT